MKRFKSVWEVGALLMLSLIAPGCGPETYHGRFLASWSPDGSRAAAVPNLTEEIPDSGIWIFDARSGQSRQIFALKDGSYCIHPQWSPFSDEILFATIRKDEGETKNPTDPEVPYSVWSIGADGHGLRKITDSTSVETSGDSDYPRIALPNTVAWGAIPGTVIFQKAVSDKVTALLLDPYTGRLTEFLPHPADAYSLEPSPSRRYIAALLYDKHTDTAEVFLADFGFDNWRRLATIGFDSDQLKVFSPMIYWAPDSSCFVLPEKEEGPGLKGRPQHHLRLFDVQTGRSWVIVPGNPNTAILWDGESRSFFFSGTSTADDEDSDSAIYRVERRNGRTIPVVSEGDNFLLSWNQDDERVVFYQKIRVKGPKGSEEITTRRFLSCASDGTDVRELGPWIEDDGVIWSTSPGGQWLIFLNNTPRFVDLLSVLLSRDSFASRK